MLFRCSSIMLVALAAICISTLANASSPGNIRSRVLPDQDAQPAMREFQNVEGNYLERLNAGVGKTVHRTTGGGNPVGDKTMETVERETYAAPAQLINTQPSVRTMGHEANAAPSTQSHQGAQPAMTKPKIRKTINRKDLKKRKADMSKAYHKTTSDENLIGDTTMKTVRRATRAGPSSQPVHAQPAAAEAEIRKAAETYYFQDVKTKIMNSKVQDGDKYLTDSEYIEAQRKAKKYAQEAPIADLEKYIKKKGN